MAAGCHPFAAGLWNAPETRPVAKHFRYMLIGIEASFIDFSQDACKSHSVTRMTMIGCFQTGCNVPPEAGLQPKTIETLTCFSFSWAYRR
jgi:hypothetical protein